MKEIIDNFSVNAAEYAFFRPVPPPELYDFLYTHVTQFGMAWDCGTGYGQVAAHLSERFSKVYATDISEEQLKHAQRKSNIIYKQERSEATTLPGNCADLITIAQAIHWFDFDNFYSEVRRVANPGAVIAAWAYDLFRLTPALNEIIDHLHNYILDGDWSIENRYIDEGYRTIPFPFAENIPPEITIVKYMGIAHLTGYLRTWSAVRKYMEKVRKDPVAIIQSDLQKAWGNTELQEVRWPIHIRCGKVV